MKLKKVISLIKKKKYNNSKFKGEIKEMSLCYDRLTKNLNSGISVLLFMAHECEI